MHQYTVKAKIINKETKEPFESDSIVVKLFDSDLIDDDFLGQSRVNEQGDFEISFGREDFVSKDSPFETKPDLYIEVLKYGQMLYKSKVMRNYDLDKKAFAVLDNRKIVDLGVFEI